MKITGVRVNQRRRRKAICGFTLVELMVALIILSLLSIASYRSLDSVLSTQQHVARETRKWQRLSLFWGSFRQDVAQAVDRPVTNASGMPEPAWLGRTSVASVEPLLVFTRAGNSQPGAMLSEPVRIGFLLADEVVYLLRWSALEAAPQTAPVRYPLLDGVREFQLRYLARSGAWADQWPVPGQSSGLPSGIEVALTLVSGEKITRVFALQ